MSGEPPEPQFGVERLVSDLRALGYGNVEPLRVAGKEYAIIRAFEVPAGPHANRIIDLGIESRPNYPQEVGASIQVRAEPQLYEKGRVERRRNVIDSPLGPDWRYWSHRFVWKGERTTRRLMSQVNSIFLNA